MSVRQTDPEALHLFQLIGAPLLAVIQAEAQAAQVSAEFIKRVGFEGPGPAAPPHAAMATEPPSPTGPAQSASPGSVRNGDAKPAPLQDGGDLGALKVAKFEIDRFTADGQSSPLVVRLPVLSLFPIPLLQVRDAEFAFNINVVSRVPLDDDPQRQNDPAMTPSRDFLQPDRVELKGFLASSGVGQSRDEANIKVRVRMEQSDLPAGLMKLMSVMSENASAVPKAVELARAAGRVGLGGAASPDGGHVQSTGGRS
jgi:uncharacterized protein DUF2589